MSHIEIQKNQNINLCTYIPIVSVNLHTLKIYFFISNYFFSYLSQSIILHRYKFIRSKYTRTSNIFRRSQFFINNPHEVLFEIAICVLFDTSVVKSPKEQPANYFFMYWAIITRIECVHKRHRLHWTLNLSRTDAISLSIPFVVQIMLNGGRSLVRSLIIIKR